MPVDILADRTTQVLSSIASAVTQAIEQTADAIVVRARLEIESGSKSGRVYTSGPPVLPHQASAPGQSPAHWTGALEESIKREMIGPQEAEVTAGGGDVDYAADLEFGSAGGKIAARPYLFPAAKEEALHFAERLTEKIVQATR